MFRIYLCAAVLYAGVLSTGTARASLIGTDLSVQVIAQSTQTSTPFSIGFAVTAVVRDPGIEFLNLATTQQSNSGNFSIVPVSVDARAFSIDIRILPSAGAGLFATTFFNGYKFTFTSAALANITGAQLDSSSTINIPQSYLSFSGNQLLVNVSGFAFNGNSTSNSLIRVNLTVTGGPDSVQAVPEPATLSVFAATGLILLGRRTWRRMSPGTAATVTS